MKSTTPWLPMILICAVACTVAMAEDGQEIGREGDDLCLYLGVTYDNFAADVLETYLNQGESSEGETNGMAGFSYQTRLFGDRTEKDSRQLWLLAEVTYGARSADVDCEKNPNLEICKTLGFNPDDPGGQVRAILRDASALEGMMGLRYEFLPLGDEKSTKLYAKLSAGIMMVSEGDDDAIDNHHIGVGIIKTDGPYKYSYCEVGFGKTDLYLDKPEDRWKFDCLLYRESARAENLGYFVQFNLDSDFGVGSDSFRTYAGIEFNLDALFGSGKKDG
jgi:hypothetical protein